MATRSRLIMVVHLQNLLYHVIILDGWSDHELRLLAKDLGVFELVPCRFHGYKDSRDSGESEQSPIDISLVVTHRVRFCSIPLTLDEPDQRRWAAVIEAGPAEPCNTLLRFLISLDSRSFVICTQRNKIAAVESTMKTATRGNFARSSKSSAI
jgi:hypothetical protein